MDNVQEAPTGSRNRSAGHSRAGATEETAGVAEVAGILDRTFLEWSSQFYHMSAMYFNWIETTQEQHKVRQSQSLESS